MPFSNSSVSRTIDVMGQDVEHKSSHYKSMNIQYCKSEVFLLAHVSYIKKEKF